MTIIGWFSAQNLWFSVKKNKRYGPVFSSSLFRGIYFIESLRSKILPNIKKKLDEKFWKFEEVEMSCEKFSTFFENRDFSKNFEIFEKFEIFRNLDFFDFQRNFINFRKFSIFEKSRKIFRNSSLTSVIFKNFRRDFFWYWVKFCCGAIQ